MSRSRSTPHIQVQSVSFEREERVILKHLSLEVARGKVTAIMGPSGCGKTTLMRLMSSEWPPTTGRVLVDGMDLSKLTRRQLFDFRKRIGVLFQSAALLTDLDVFENVALPLREHTRLSDQMIQDLVYMKLQAVGLRGAAQFMPAELSGGMMRRVALARAIALDPALVFYDEPFAGQDPVSMGTLLRLIRTLNQNLGLTSVVVSHDIQETFAIADYVYILGEAHVLAEGTVEELSTSRDPWVLQFLRGDSDGPVSFHMSALDWREALLKSKEAS